LAGDEAQHAVGVPRGVDDQWQSPREEKPGDGELPDRNKTGYCIQRERRIRRPLSGGRDICGARPVQLYRISRDGTQLLAVNPRPLAPKSAFRARIACSHKKIIFRVQNMDKKVESFGFGHR